MSPSDSIRRGPGAELGALLCHPPWRQLAGLASLHRGVGGSDARGSGIVCILGAVGLLLVLLGGCGRGAGTSTGAPEPPPSGTASFAPSPSAGADAPGTTASASTASGAPTGASTEALDPDSTASAVWPPPVIDLHTDVPWQVGFRDRSPELSEGHVTIDKLGAGHYRGVVFVLYLPHAKRTKSASPDSIESILKTASDLVSRHDELRWAALPGAPPAAVDGKHVDVFLGIEGADAFAKDIEAVDRFLDRGVRYVGLLHSTDNPLGTSATGKGRGGLTKAGRELAARVYQKGALVDASHLSDASFEDLVPLAEAAGAPLLASHSNSRAVYDHPRNLTDEQLRTIGNSGGVAGVNLHRSFVKRSKAKLEHVVAHVEHMVEVAGIEHVAIGTDFDGGNPVGDLSDASRLPELAEELRRRGMSREDVHRIFWRNALRVLRWSPRQAP